MSESAEDPAPARRIPTTLLVLRVPSNAFALPLLPLSAAGTVLALNPDAGNTIGWPSFAQQVSVQSSEG